MPLDVVCPGCSAKLRVPDVAAGKQAKCPKCQTLMAIPAAAPPPEPEFEVVEPPARNPARAVDDDDRTPLKVKGGADEDDDRPRKKKEKKKSGGRTIGLEWDDGLGTEPKNVLAGMGTIMMIAGGALILWIITLLIALAVPAMFVIPLLIGYLVMFVGNNWFLVIAFSDDVGQGLLCPCVPFYSLFDLPTYWDECKFPFLLGLGGFAMTMVTSCAGGAALRDQDDRAQVGHRPVVARVS